MMDKNLPKIGVSACLLGLPVRYDATGRLQPHIVNFFAGKAELVPICPETEAGFGIPRETIEFVNGRLTTTKTQIDLTHKMQAWIDTKLRELPNLQGFIFKARSPSCDIQQGMFALALAKAQPNLVIANEETLQKNSSLEEFFQKITYLALP